MKVKKIPMRTCVVNHTQHPKKELIRIVCTKENEVSVDLTGKANGRGAYILLSTETVIKAQKTKALNAKLGTNIPQNIYDELMELAKKNEQQS
jgi:predicted RNA-binding protein YlxR (DUF448 family)